MKTKGLLALAAALVALLLSAGESAAQQLPLAPIIYSGAVQVGDAPAPDGYSVYAQVEDYRSESVTVSNGRYGPLNVLPGEGRNYENKTIMFYLDGEPATQTDVFRRTNLPIIKSNFDLTFAKLPEPTPTPTAVPTDTPTPTPTVPATATPTVANAMTFVSGFVVSVSGGPVPADGALVARIGSYESEPAALTPDGGFVGLLVDPGDVSLIGQDVEFYLDGHKARTTVPFESGGFERQFDIVFVGLPQVEPTATHTPMPTSTQPPSPTPTPAPPTATPVPPPTATPVPPPTSTPVPPPTATPVPPPTSTPVPPPTATPVPPPTSTPVPPPTATPRAQAPSPPPDTGDSGGACGSVGPVSFGTGAANMALLLAPLGLAVGLRRLRIRASKG